MIGITIPKGTEIHDLTFSLKGNQKKFS